MLKNYMNNSDVFYYIRYYQIDLGDEKVITRR